MLRTVAAILAVCVASWAGAQGRLEYRVEPTVDLYMHVRWLAQQEAEDVPARLAPAVGACRAISREFGRDFLAWGFLDGLVPACRDARAIRSAFEGLPDPVRLRDGREVRVREHALALSDGLIGVEAWWLERRWTERERTILHARAGLERTLSPREGECLASMIEALGVVVDDRAVPVLLVVDAPWPGAMTFMDRSGHGVCFASIACADDTAFAETILHEATHALDVGDAGDQSVFTRLREGLLRLGVDPRSPVMRDVPHNVMFIHAGATIRRFVDAQHLDYGERDGLYARSSYAREMLPIWHGHLRGELSRDEAIERILGLVGAGERRGGG